MSAGTLTLTNNSAAVAGSGTAFTTEVADGDFIVVTVGGVPYTLPVKSVESGTALTLVSNFTGPTQSGAAWSAVPREALNMVTAAMVVQNTEALRGLNYDKQNWQQLFSGTGTITVRLPDGLTYTGPSWKYLANNMATKVNGAVPVEQGGTGSLTKEGARNSLELGTCALANVTTSDTDVQQGRVMAIGSGGWMKENGAGWIYNGPLSDIRWNSIFYAFSSIMPDTFMNSNHHVMNLFGYTDNKYGNQLAITLAGNVGIRVIANNVVNNWQELLTTGNTIVDSSGFIKKASPVIKIYSDGKFDTNEESEGVTVSRLGVGEYVITGCTGMNSDAAWCGIDGGFEIPVDRNKQPQVWLDYEVTPDGSVHVKTYHRTYPDAPEFARNELPGLNDGDPVDIPADQFVSVRVEMPVDSIWNQKQKEMQEEMEKIERERRKNQQEAPL
ncbi:phage tail protein [Citrobacter freundii]|nr:phage tail protein [Citrobacter freundii]HCC5909603.1 phage tail protein [Citrobacter freundii]